MVEPYYQDDHATIYHGDCLDLIGHIRCEVVITDPPYDMRTHENIRSWGDIPGKRSEAERVDFSGATAYYLREVFRALDVQRWLVSFLDNRHCAEMLIDPPRGLEFVRQSVWTKPRGAPQLTGDRPAMWWESIAIMHPPGAKHWNGGGGPANFHHDTDRETAHPTAKPLSILRSLVELFSDRGETVVDPFMGSGSTLRAAKDLGRKAIGIEIEEQYCEVAAKRLAQEVFQFDEYTSAKHGTCQRELLD